MRWWRSPSFRAWIPADRNVNQHSGADSPGPATNSPHCHILPAQTSLPFAPRTDIRPTTAGRCRPPAGWPMPWLELQTPKAEVRLPGLLGKLLTTIWTRRQCSGPGALIRNTERKASHTLALRLDRVDPAGAALKQDLPGIPLEPDLGVGVM